MEYAMSTTNEQLNMVHEFHTKFGIPILDKPQIPDFERVKARFEMSIDENIEQLEDSGLGNVIEQLILFKQALKTFLDQIWGNQNVGDIINVMKELADMMYIGYGTVLEFGGKECFDEVFAEVHRSNMTKTHTSDDKMEKGDTYEKANIRPIVLKYMCRLEENDCVVSHLELESCYART